MNTVKCLVKGLLVYAVFFMAAAGAAWGEAKYTSDDGILDLPAVDVPGYGLFSVRLSAQDSTEQAFVLQGVRTSNPGSGVDATFDAATGKLEIPYLVMYAKDGQTVKYVTAELELEPGTEPAVFRVTGIVGLQLGVDDNMGPKGDKGDTGATGPQGP